MQLRRQNGASHEELQPQHWTKVATLYLLLPNDPRDIHKRRGLLNSKDLSFNKIFQAINVNRLSNSQQHPYQI